MALDVPPNATIHDVPPSTAGTGRFSLTYDDDYPVSTGLPRLEDIAQLSLGDCFFLAPLIAIMHRPAGVAFIRDIMVPTSMIQGRTFPPRNREIVVRLYYPAQNALYLKTRRCRVTDTATGSAVSPRTHCWPDVIEACAAIFTMKSKGALTMNLAQPSLDNLHLGSAEYAFQVLLGANTEDRTLPDPRSITQLSTQDGTFENYAYGMLEGLFDKNLPQNVGYESVRETFIKECFQGKGPSFETWAASFLKYNNRKTPIDVFLDKKLQQRKFETEKTALAGGKSAAEAKAAAAKAVHRRLDKPLFEEFLSSMIPPNFRAGLRKLEQKTSFIPGSGTDPLYTPNQNSTFDEITNNLNSGFPMVLISRSYFGELTGATGPSGETGHKGVLSEHTYAVERTEVDGKGIKWIQITNPWGKYVRGYDNLTGKALDLNQSSAASGLNYGRFKLHLHDLFKVFERYVWSLRSLN